MVEIGKKGLFYIALPLFVPIWFVQIWCRAWSRLPSVTSGEIGESESLSGPQAPYRGTLPQVAKAESQGHKRKRSIQDTPINLNKIWTAMLHLQVLKEELADIEETEGEVEALMAHVTIHEPHLNM